MDKSITIDGQHYDLLGVQRGGAAVYRGSASYARIGPKEVITRDLSLHRAMEKAKFPVAGILGEGELIGSIGYFIEEALGARSFRAIFQEDLDTRGSIQKENFDAFTGMVKKLFAAQIKCSEKKWNIDEFAEGIHLPSLLKELPDHRDALARRFEEACARLQKLPSTLTHGDCNPANMYEKGIIDLEDSFHGPLGYDAVSALMTIDWVPDTKMYEFHAQYRFTDEQKKQYLQTLSKITSKVKLPNIELHLEDLTFCRAVWLCNGMNEWPRTQQWRFEKLVKTYLS